MRLCTLDCAVGFDTTGAVGQATSSSCVLFVRSNIGFAGCCKGVSERRSKDMKDGRESESGEMGTVGVVGSTGRTGT